MKWRQSDRKPFFEEVYSIVNHIPCGMVATYGDVARLAGYPQCARMVGRALWCVPAGLSVPCHRVVNSCGRTVPGWAEQTELLASEGITFRSNGCVDMARHRWTPEE